MFFQIDTERERGTDFFNKRPKIDPRTADHPGEASL